MKMMLGDYCLAELCAAHSGNGYHAMTFGDTDYHRVAASLDGARSAYWRTCRPPPGRL